MIDFFFGKPRSGKTYRAMKLIFDLYIAILIKGLTPKYTNVLTNVGGFNFKKVNQIFQDNGSQSVAYKLVWKEFYKHIEKMYQMALDDKTDEELNRYADYHKINDCLIVLDEASLYMKKYDDVISWWLAYHGHFKIRIIIIAQSPKQINPEYMSHTEIFYEAQPQAKQLRSDQLRYIHYSDIPFNKESKFSSNTITTDQSIYDLYKSGEVDKPKKIVYKFIAIMVFSLIALFLVVKYLFSSISDRHQVEDIDSSAPGATSSINHQVVANEDLLMLRCTNSHCWNLDTKFKDTSISISYLKFFLLKNDIQLEYYEVKNEIFRLIEREKGYQKITLGELTDYYYMIPKEYKYSYLKLLYQPREIEKKDFKVNKPFEGMSMSSDLDNGV